MARVFLSYRWKDSKLATTMIYERLQASFGQENVFMDRESLPKGESFQGWIDRELETAEVVALFVIQHVKRWLAHMKADPDNDSIYLEVKKALEMEGRGKPIRVLPLLVGDQARLPEEEELPATIVGLRRAYRRLSTDHFSEDIKDLERDI